MSDLISKGLLIEHLDVCLAESDGHTPLTDAVLMAVKCAVEQMPTIDAVEVVQCRECKWYCVDEHQCKRQIYMLVFGDDFCSYGERKEVRE